MKKIAIAAAVALLAAGCAHAPMKQQPQVNRTAKSDKLKVSAKPDNSTPNQVVKNRWFPKFKVKWLHSK